MPNLRQYDNQIQEPEQQEEQKQPENVELKQLDQNLLNKLLLLVSSGN